MATEFYVYEHSREDTGAVFYVGKGSGVRLRCTQHRNIHWQRVARKAGWVARIVFRTEDEELAFLAEQELIDKHRRLGNRLTNMTDGGEGMSGFKFSADAVQRRAAKQLGQKRPTVSAKLRGVPKSEEHCKKLAEARVGIRASDATKAKMSQQRKGRKSHWAGKRLSDEHRAAISNGITGERNPFFGRSHTDETRERLSVANTGRLDSDETRLKKSIAHKGKRTGMCIPEEQKARQIAALKARPRVTCPHCQKTMDEANARRWHLDNCKEAA